MLVQELVGGVRETIKLFRDEGQTLARVAMLVDRTWPPLGGSSVMRRTIAPPEDTLDLAERLVAEIGLDGYSEAEFRRDADGRPLLMEINPRLSQSVELAVRAGVDFPRMQLEWARGGKIPAAAEPPRSGCASAGSPATCGCSSGRSRGSPPPKPQLGSTLRAIALATTCCTAPGSRASTCAIRGRARRARASRSGASARGTSRAARGRGTRRPCGWRR